MATHIELTQIRSTIGRPKDQRLTMLGLGLGKMHRTVKVKDTPAIRGMVTKVQHLVTVRVVEGDVATSGRRSKK